MLKNMLVLKETSRIEISSIAICEVCSQTSVQIQGLQYTNYIITKSLFMLTYPHLWIILGIALKNKWESTTKYNVSFLSFFA